ncbi:hypothetical protein [Microbacterium sp.]|uniref:hypothetical protein n=1 Tax=Microbacterium sp. TaxID=51671 RepID=UPI003F9604BF
MAGASSTDLAIRIANTDKESTLGGVVVVAAMIDPVTLERVRSHLAEGQALGVSGTPNTPGASPLTYDHALSSRSVTTPFISTRSISPTSSSL